MKFKQHLDEVSASQAIDRGKQLIDLLDEDALEQLQAAGMKTQKEAAKVFKQAITLIKGLGKEKRVFKKTVRRM